MSGSKRKSHYRKSVTAEYENGFPEPDEGKGELVCKILKSRGDMFEVSIAGSEAIQLAILPNKFKSLIWVKRNDFVIVERVTDEETKVKYSIRYILNKQQIKHLRNQGKWPSEFSDSSAIGGVAVDDLMPEYESPDEDMGLEEGVGKSASELPLEGEK